MPAAWNRPVQNEKSAQNMIQTKANHLMSEETLHAEFRFCNIFLFLPSKKGQGDFKPLPKPECVVSSLYSLSLTESQ